MMLDHNLFNVGGRTAVVTGGAGHIGGEFCRLFASLGGRCVILDKSQDDVDKMVANLPKLENLEHMGYALDLADQQQIMNCVAWISQTLASLNVLVNNAAFTGDSKLKGWVADFEDQSVDAWNAAFGVNLTPAFLLSQQLAPIMRKAQSPAILNIASIYGVLGPDMDLYEGTKMGNPAAYAASKGGLIQLTRWLATVLAPDIRVNAISAGGIARGQDHQFTEKYIAKVPLNRMGNEDDIAKAMLFLTSDLSSYITGQNLLVDGGFSAW
jgi:NAD(P)-dependent dehydrogenase (short-subunit alcohol dehydrogenase family)